LRIGRRINPKALCLKVFLLGVLRFFGAFSTIVGGLAAVRLVVALARQHALIENRRMARRTQTIEQRDDSKKA
jgi:hypothetical protein